MHPTAKNRSELIRKRPESETKYIVIPESHTEKKCLKRNEPVIKPDHAVWAMLRHVDILTGHLNRIIYQAPARPENDGVQRQHRSNFPIA